MTGEINKTAQQGPGHGLENNDTTAAIYLDQGEKLGEKTRGQVAKYRVRAIECHVATIGRFRGSHSTDNRGPFSQTVTVPRLASNRKPVTCSTTFKLRDIEFRLSVAGMPNP
jgi:hypothetical protein